MNSESDVHMYCIQCLGESDGWMGESDGWMVEYWPFDVHLSSCLLLGHKGEI